MTCTRAASAKVNQLATQVLFHDRHKQPLGRVPLDFEANEDNFGPSGELREGRLHAAQTDIFQGQRVFLTRNLDKDHDFVNGMAAIVDAFEAVANCLMLTTSTGRRLAVHLYTEEVEDHGKVTFFPVRNGYACTIQKIQGATLSHVTAWLDRPACRAAAYVALSRVERDEDYLLAGCLSPKHFVPAQ